MLSKLAKFDIKMVDPNNDARVRLMSLLTLACLFLSRCDGVGSLEGNVRLTAEMLGMLKACVGMLGEKSSDGDMEYSSVSLTGHVVRTLAWCLASPKVCYTCPCTLISFYALSAWLIGRQCIADRGNDRNAQSMRWPIWWKVKDDREYSSVTLTGEHLHGVWHHRRYVARPFIL